MITMLLVLPTLAVALLLLAAAYMNDPWMTIGFLWLSWQLVKPRRRHVRQGSSSSKSTPKAS